MQSLEFGWAVASLSVRAHELISRFLKQTKDFGNEARRGTKRFPADAWIQLGGTDNRYADRLGSDRHIDSPSEVAGLFLPAQQRGGDGQMGHPVHSVSGFERGLSVSGSVHGFFANLPDSGPAERNDLSERGRRGTAGGLADDRQRRHHH